jgi:hypothetical protein
MLFRRTDKIERKKGRTGERERERGDIPGYAGEWKIVRKYNHSVFFDNEKKLQKRRRVSIIRRDSFFSSKISPNERRFHHGQKSRCRKKTRHPGWSQSL